MQRKTQNPFVPAVLCCKINNVEGGGKGPFTTTRNSIRYGKYLSPREQGIRRQSLGEQRRVGREPQKPWGGLHLHVQPAQAHFTCWAPLTKAHQEAARGSPSSHHQCGEVQN